MFVLRIDWCDHSSFLDCFSCNFSLICVPYHQSHTWSFYKIDYIMKLGELERLMGFLFTGDVWRHQKPQGCTVLSSHNQWSRKFLQPCKPRSTLTGAASAFPPPLRADQGIGVRKQCLLWVLKCYHSARLRSYSWLNRVNVRKKCISPSHGIIFNRFLNLRRFDLLWLINMTRRTLKGFQHSSCTIFCFVCKSTHTPKGSWTQSALNLWFTHEIPLTSIFSQDRGRGWEFSPNLPCQCEGNWNGIV